MLDVTKLLDPQFQGSNHLRYDRARRGPRKPVVVWSLTRSCNLRCIHCYADAARRRIPGELEPEEVHRILEELAEVGVAALLLSGGEPLLRPDLFSLARSASRLGIPTTLSTNGTLIDGERAERIREAGFRYVGISLDGLAERHDFFRGSRGAFVRAIRGIRHCRAVGQKVGLRLTLSRHTVADLPGIFRLIEEEGIERVCFYHLVFSGRGRGIRDAALSSEEARRSVETIFAKALEWRAEGRPVEVLTVDNHADAPFFLLWASRRLSPERVGEINRMLSANGGNNSGVALVHIDNRGNVHPDQFSWGTHLGNLRSSSFRTIWSDPAHPLLRSLRNRKEHLPGRCRACRFLSVCNGNFRARALGATGDYWGFDPGCYLTEEERAAA